MYTSVGFNAGDYVYQYGANLVGWPKGATTSLGVENTAIAGNTYTGYAQTGINTRAASYGPFSDTYTYSNATVTAGQTIVSPTTLSGATYAVGSIRCCTLTDGRIAYAYRTGSTTLVTAIYNTAGVIQGSTTTITTNYYHFDGLLTMAALSDGGFIVTFYDTGTGYTGYSRLNSSNTITVNSAQIFLGNVSSFVVAASPNYYAFSSHSSSGTSQATLKIYSMSGNSLTGTYTFTGSSVYLTGCAGTSQDTFYIAIADTGTNATFFNHINTSGGNLGSANYASANNGGGGVFTNIPGTSSTANTTYPGAYAANFAIINSSGQIIIIRLYVASAGTANLTSGSTGITTYTQFALGSISNGGCVLTYRGPSNYLYYATYNAAGSQIATGTLVSAVTTNTALGVSGIAGGTFAYCYAAQTTGYATLASAYTTTYTNGVTVLNGTTSYTPANGYYILGVALTTAAAGSTGMVATNGSANLGSSYPTVTSNILFDSTGTAFTARSAINANRGNVIGTNVTLRGLE
jgi:hypothetical protein